MRPGALLDSTKCRYLHTGRGDQSATRNGEAGAGDETRTRDVLLGKEVLYH